jgi:hypothetical protein
MAPTLPFNPLATAAQREVEAQALGLFASPPVQQAIERSRALFMADPRAATPAGRATIEQNLNEWAFSASTCAASMQPARPCVCWTLNLPHRWFGLDVPGSRHGVDNPDNLYRVIAVDARSHYELRGRVPAHPGPDVSFTVFSAYPGNGADSHSLGVLTLADLDLDAEGRFMLEVDPVAPEGRRNHLQVKEGAELLFVRDSLHDWGRESPIALEVRRLSGPPATALDDDALARRAAEIVDRAVPYWIRSMPKWFAQRPHNVVPPAAASNFAYAKQATSGAQFRIAEDEALVVTADPMGAAYFGFQIADPWGSAPDYANHTASLNAAQARANDDSTVTFVVALRDPQVHNWVDTVGLEEGTLLIRWQALPAGGIDPRRSIRQVALVKLSDVAEVLPKGAHRVSADDRRHQLAARKAAYARRLVEA